MIRLENWPPEDRVHHRQREVVGRAPRRRRPGRRPGPTAPRPACRRGRPSPPSTAAARAASARGPSPGFQSFSAFSRTGGDRVGRGVADDDQGGVVGQEQPLVEGDDVVAGQRLDRLRRAEVGAAVGVVLAVEEPAGRRPRRSPRRCRAAPGAAASRWTPEPVQLLRRERRVEQDVGVEVERLGRVLGQGRQRERARLEARRRRRSRRRSPTGRRPARASRATSSPRSAASAVSEASPSLPAGTSVSPPLTTRFRRQDRQLVPLGDQHLQAVREPPAHDRRRGELRASGRAWASTERSNVSLTAAAFGLASGRLLRAVDRRPRRAAAVGGPGTTSSRTRSAVRYCFATRLTSAGVTAKSRTISAL